jgi:hypothetical protein
VKKIWGEKYGKNSRKNRGKYGKKYGEKIRGGRFLLV